MRKLIYDLNGKSVIIDYFIWQCKNNMHSVSTKCDGNLYYGTDWIQAKALEEKWILDQETLCATNTAMSLIRDT